MFYRAKVLAVRVNDKTKDVDDSIEVFVPAFTPEYKEGQKKPTETSFSIILLNQDIENPIEIKDGKVDVSNTFVAYPLEHAGSSEHGSLMIPNVGDEVLVTYLNNDKSQLYYKQGSKKVEGEKLDKNPKTLKTDFVKKVKPNPAEKGKYRDNNSDETLEATVDNRAGYKVIYKSKSGGAIICDDNSGQVIVMQGDTNVILKGSEIVIQSPATVIMKTDNIHVEASQMDIFSNIDIEGNVKIKGNLDVDGDISTTGNVIEGSGVCLGLHTHPGVGVPDPC